MLQVLKSRLSETFLFRFQCKSNGCPSENKMVLDEGNQYWKGEL